MKLLGTGGTARVYLARDKRTESLVALKVISKTGRNKDQLNDVINEQKIHRLVSDPADQFILPILGSWHDELNFFIVTVRDLVLYAEKLTLIFFQEFIPGSDLAVETMKSRKLGEEAVRFYAAELVSHPVPRRSSVNVSSIGGGSGFVAQAKHYPPRCEAWQHPPRRRRPHPPL